MDIVLQCLVYVLLGYIWFLFYVRVFKIEPIYSEGLINNEKAMWTARTLFILLWPLVVVANGAYIIMQFFIECGNG